jgi:hypothetical protein
MAFAEWSGRAGGDVALGEIRAADSRLVLSRLARYASRIAGLRREGHVFEIFLGDGNGTTVAAIVATRCEGRRAAVTQVLLDEKFEE